MFSLKNIIGFDLGTSKFRFYKEGKLFSEIVPEITIDNKIHNNLIKGGKIADFYGTENLLNKETRKINPPFLKIFVKAFSGFISVSSDSNEVALRAWRDVMDFVGCKDAYLLPDCYIASAGLDLNIKQSIYTIIDCGAGKTGITTLKNGEIISSDILEEAGNSLDEAIKTHISKNYDLILSSKEIFEIKSQYIDVREANQTDRTIRIGGKDKTTLQIKNISVQSKELSDYIEPDIHYIIKKIARHIENLDDPIKEKIEQNGIYLIGGSFKLKGLIERISEKVPIHTKSHSTNIDYMRLGMERILANPTEFQNYMFR
ncbi:MAG: rod shape-determining protein [Dysgonomonas sp.]|nr:rod shape-determining protein [Dysgonomonas sp.]